MLMARLRGEEEETQRRKTRDKSRWQSSIKIECNGRHEREVSRKNQ